MTCLLLLFTVLGGVVKIFYFLFFYYYFPTKFEIMSTKRPGSRIPSAASFRNDNSSTVDSTVNTGSRQRQSKRDEVIHIYWLCFFSPFFYIKRLCLGH